MHNYQNIIHKNLYYLNNNHFDILNNLLKLILYIQYILIEHVYSLHMKFHSKSIRLNRLNNLLMKYIKDKELYKPYNCYYYCLRTLIIYNLNNNLMHCKTYIQALKYNIVHRVHYSNKKSYHIVYIYAQLMCLYNNQYNFQDIRHMLHFHFNNILVHIISNTDQQQMYFYNMIDNQVHLLYSNIIYIYQHLNNI